MWGTEWFKKQQARYNRKRQGGGGGNGSRRAKALRMRGWAYAFRGVLAGDLWH